jgi:hypothetical protein
MRQFNSFTCCTSACVTSCWLRFASFGFAFLLRAHFQNLVSENILALEKNTNEDKAAAI